MANNYRKEKYIFRIFRVSKSISTKFEKTFTKSNYRIVDLSKVRFRKCPGKFTIILDLTKKQNYLFVAKQIDTFIKKHKISKKLFGIRSSLVTSRDSDELAVPEHVLRFYNIVGGGSDFSFTCV